MRNKDNKWETRVEKWETRVINEKQVQKMRNKDNKWEIKLIYEKQK